MGKPQQPDSLTSTLRSMIIFLVYGFRICRPEEGVDALVKQFDYIQEMQ
jgi:hypothetical protein